MSVSPFICSETHLRVCSPSAESEQPRKLTLGGIGEILLDVFQSEGIAEDIMGRSGGVGDIVRWWQAVKRNGPGSSLGEMRVGFVEPIDVPNELRDLLDHLEANADPCLLKAGKDEPIFVLRGQDALAPDQVDLWISDYRTYVLHPQGKDKPVGEGTDAKIEAAIKCRDEMRAWPTRRMPD